MFTDTVFTEVPILETENYLLSGLTMEDAVELFAFMRDKETMKFITARPVQSVEDMEAKVQEQLDSYEQGKEIPWVIVEKWSETVVVQFSLHKLNMWHKKAEMGVTIKKEYQNKGVMTEILEKVLSFGFERLGLNRIVGDIFAGNKRSAKLLKKYGFTKEGLMRQTDFDGERYHDTVVFSMMRSEYESISVKAKHS